MSDELHNYTETGIVRSSDDIVIRLREGDGQGCKCYADYWYECACDAIWAEQYILEAADEIERLRAELADCNNDFDCLKQIHDKVRSERDQLLEGVLNNVHLS